MGFLMLPHPLTNFEIIIQVLSKRSIIKMNQDLIVFILETTCLKIKDGAYVINLDEYAGVGTHWVALLCKRNEIVYFDYFSVECTSEEIEKFIGNKNIKSNIFQVQADNSIMCGLLHWIH